MTTITPEDAIKAASSIARDVADGKLAPADLEAQLDTELRTLVGQVIGPDDPLFALQVDIARGVLAVGGIPVDEQAEWLAVARHRAGEPVSDLTPDDAPPELVSLPTVALVPASVDAEPIAQPVEIVAVPVTEPAPAVTPLSQTGYDPLAGWSPGRARNR